MNASVVHAIDLLYGEISTRALADRLTIDTGQPIDAHTARRWTSGSRPVPAPVLRTLSLYLQRYGADAIEMADKLARLADAAPDEPELPAADPAPEPSELATMTALRLLARMDLGRDTVFLRAQAAKDALTPKQQELVRRVIDRHREKLPPTLATAMFGVDEGECER